MAKAGLRYTVNCAAMPEPVYVDRDMWEKIVLNLLSNAFKYTLQGEIAVSLQPSPDGANAELVVRDTGAGIPAHEIPRLFDRFHRIEGQIGRTHEGTGIGLALVHELVRQHGGTIHVHSTPGLGSTFTVAMPLGSAHLPANRIGAKRLPGSSELPAQSFVDDALRWLPGGSLNELTIQEGPAAHAFNGAARQGTRPAFLSLTTTRTCVTIFAACSVFVTK